MTWSTEENPARAEVLQALADAGRHQSTAMILFHTNLSKRVGLGTTEEKVLELVRRHDHPSVGDLAAHTGMAKNSISDVLDRLEAKGFVARERHPEDGRKVAIIATEEGVARIGRLFAGLMGRLSQLQAEYTTEELALIAEYQRRAAEIQSDEARTLAEES
ncbi:MarR family transcriptional regulator [Glutamicibacter sp. MNS18]|uniref:MarR family winged helix-turn-helix transcriptional regulator n=1 Tax=Glutamicibacter sp. MNS18 TaxID=2989817 RepID=UPI00223591B7|nr:MarR family transcriptional regulator [Glutamicibacter sp. MNS18]MCW4465996.1 MarR family transcriptional regulator [Glutamicibacter sp. MNS18]